MKTYSIKKLQVQVCKEEKFAIVLSSNPSTGYKWIAQFNKEFIQEISRKFELKGRSIGSGGNEKFVFTAVKRGECQIRMLYRRPWEEKLIKEEIFEVQISENKDKMKKRKIEHTIIFGDSQNMKELKANSVHLVVTSPPYFNAPFDYPDLFESYEEFLKMMRKVAIELKRVLDKGRIAAFVCDDTLIKGKKYPIVADIIKTFVEEGFKYRERIIWIKPEGYIRISRRSGVLLQHPYPMYYYPDNLQESILIFQNDEFDYKKISQEVRENSKLDLNKYQKEKWYLNVWYITNVLPMKNRLEKGIAAFPEEIPRRLTKLFSYKGETVLDPFMGSGTTLKVAKDLGRKSVGYEIDIELLDIVKKKLQIGQSNLFPQNDFQIITRKDIKHLRKTLQDKVNKKIKSRKRK